MHFHPDFVLSRCVDLNEVGSTIRRTDVFEACENVVELYQIRLSAVCELPFSMIGFRKQAVDQGS